MTSHVGDCISCYVPILCYTDIRLKLSNGNSKITAMKGEMIEWNSDSHFSFCGIRRE